MRSNHAVCLRLRHGCIGGFFGSKCNGGCKSDNNSKRMTSTGLAWRMHAVP